MEKHLESFDEFKDNSLTENIKFDLSTGPGAEHLLNISKEKAYATRWEFVPCEKLKVVDYFADMRDDFNGNAEVELSNGHKIIYECNEIPGKRGSSYEVIAYIDLGRQTYNYLGDDFLNEYASNGMWIQGLLDFYTDWKNNNQ